MSELIIMSVLTVVAFAVDENTTEYTYNIGDQKR